MLNQKPQWSAVLSTIFSYKETSSLLPGRLLNWSAAFYSPILYPVLIKCAWVLQFICSQFSDSVQKSTQSRKKRAKRMAQSVLDQLVPCLFSRLSSTTVWCLYPPLQRSLLTAVALKAWTPFITGSWRVRSSLSSRCTRTFNILS